MLSRANSNEVLINLFWEDFSSIADGKVINTITLKRREDAIRRCRRSES